MNENKSSCSGCTACASICPVNAIKMTDDEEGFVYPIIDKEKCIHCNKCERVCPFHKQSQHTDQYPLAFAGRIRDGQIRKNSATAGIFTAISDWILEQNGIIYGVCMTEEKIVKHIRAESIEERNNMRGSKYVQSSVIGIFEQIKNDLLQNRKVLFTGTPCQVAGLKAYIDNSVEIRSKEMLENLISCDIICHGVPSPLIFREWITYMEKKGKAKIKRISFRDKTRGWKKQAWKIEMTDGKQYVDNIWIQYYKHWMYGHFILRPSCHECVFTSINRVGDITLGDFWNVWNVLPDFGDNEGVASILVNSNKGMQIIKQIEKSCQLQQITIDDCMQEQLKVPTKSNDHRTNFWTTYRTEGIKGNIKHFSGLSTKGKIRITLKDVWNRIKDRGRRYGK